MNHQYHKILSGYFANEPLYFDKLTPKKPNTRKLVEQPWQQTKGELWEEVTETLCSLDFIQAKAAARMTYELMGDFNTVFQVIPDNQENIRNQNTRQDRMEKYIKDFTLYSKGEIATLEIPESIPLQTHEQTEAEVDRLLNNPNRTDRLRDFANFLGHEADNLQNYAWEIRHFTIQQAWNSAADGPIAEAAVKCSPRVLSSLLLRNKATCPPWNPFYQAMKTLRGHTSSVHAVAITPDGKRAISGSAPKKSSEDTSNDDNFCIVWDLTTGKALYTLKGHTSGVRTVSITPDGKRAISGSEIGWGYDISDDDITCVAWDLTTGKALQNLKGHTSRVNVSIFPDGERAISSGFDDSICYLWDLTTGVVLETLKRHPDCIRTFSITPDGERAVSDSGDNTCILWDLRKGTIIQKLKGHADSVEAVSITPDGNRAISGSRDNCCILWDLTTGKVIQKLKGHTDIVRAVCITPDGTRAISGSQDGTCLLWNLTNGEVIQTLKGHTDWIRAVSITPDGTRAISGSEDGTCILWDLTTIGEFHFIEKDKPLTPAVPVTLDEQRAVTGSMDKNCIQQDPIRKEEPQTCKRHSYGVKALSITPDGKRVISRSGTDDYHCDTSGNNNTCIVWDLTTGAALRTLKAHTDIIRDISITLDGERAISSSFENCIIWDLTSGEVIKTLNGSSRISLTPDGKWALSSSGDDRYVLWNLETGNILLSHLYNDYPVNAISISPDGKRAICGTTEGINLLDLIREDSSLTLGDSDDVRAVSISPDGKMAITGSADHACCLWDLTTGKPVQWLEGHSSPVKSVSFKRDGRRAITVSEDRTCILWDLTAGIVHSHEWHDTVKAVSRPSVKKLAEASMDKTFILWDMENGEKLAQVTTASEIDAAAIFPNGVILGCSSGEVIIYYIDKNILHPGIAITTARQIWDFELQKNLEISADCPLCGHRFAPPVSVLNTIEEITKIAGLGPEQSPCLELPEEVWEEPGLLCNCPNCGVKLKFNPFIAGGE